jgi:uncharacterized protein YdiU (UPF0061 family)
MIVHWQRVGFVHGVMNTDNMSILGLTIDYGPYGWLENYDPQWTPNTTDAEDRRYRYENQPQIAYWNLAQLGNAIYPLIGEVEPLQTALHGYIKTFDDEWRAMMAAKLGLREFIADEDDVLCAELFQVLQLAETDMTLFFRQLAHIDLSLVDQELLIAPLLVAYYQPEVVTGQVKVQILAWLNKYCQRIAKEQANNSEANAQRQNRMNAVNPKYVLRNYLAQLAIDAAASGDFSGVADLLAVLRNPYDEQPGSEKYAEKRPEWARHRAGCSMLSCSS